MPCLFEHFQLRSFVFAHNASKCLQTNKIVLYFFGINYFTSIKLFLAKKINFSRVTITINHGNDNVDDDDGDK